MNEVIALIALFFFFLAFLLFKEGQAMRKRPACSDDKKNSVAFYIWGIIAVFVGGFLIKIVGGPLAFLLLIKNIAIILWPK
ncbi:hypothetical protein KA089_01705 [Candidatus Woesebacteria bacterium]|nr:hypothetical protein [Candidatus Woesebacteria bacterium]